MNIPLTRLEELKRHKSFMIHQSRKKSMERKEREKDNKIERFNDYTSHNLKEFIEPSDYININKLLKKHIYRNNKLEHELKKVEIFVELLYDGNDVILEPQLKDKSLGRPDILLLNQIPAVAYEIINSEKEESLLLKDMKYPFMIKRIKVNNNTTRGEL